MAIAKQLRVTLSNQPGALAQLCSELAKRAVNIRAMHATTAPVTGVVRFVPDRPDVAKQVCANIGLSCAEEEVLAVKVGDRPGALGKVTRKLGEKGVNIEYLYGSIDSGCKRALIILGVSDLATAERFAR